MANDFSGVLPIVIAQSLMSLREQALITRHINRDFENVPQAQGDTVNVTLPGPVTASDVTPSATPIVAGDTKPVKVPITLSQWKKSNMVLTDKEVGMITAGIRPSQISVHMRALANTVNSYFYALYKRVYGFAGTPGTNPFATDTQPILDARTVLNNQLAPMDGRKVILDVNAEAKAFKISDIVRADARGNGDAITSGRLSTTFGMDWFMDQLIPTHTSTPLTAGAATVNGAQAVGVGSTDNGRTGTLSIAKATNAAPLVKGDIITIAGDTQTYVVLADVTLAVGNTSVSIAPALQKATAGGEAITLKATHVVNLVFHPDAFMFASRPLSDVGGAANTFQQMDPVTGISLRGEIIRQHKQTVIEFDYLFGGECVRPELACRLAG
ncbi:MAG TPA: P22 phage major capsid protein family protein [Candidatus Limnocylindria bacterium]|nr:P22 phage major capsid protein family protein [Candidatus Limnocylindria bacterium]